MIGSTKLFINSDSQKEILLNWDQLRWFNQLKRGRIVLTRLAGKNQEILEATDLDSHTTIPLICRGSHGNTRVIFYRFNANLLCKLAIYCVDFGVNFIFQNFCPCKKNDKLQVCIPLLSPQKSAMLLQIAWLKKIFDKRCTILFSAISEMNGAKKSELDSEHVLDISKIFWQIICSAASLLRDSRKVNNPLIIFLWEQHTLYAGHIVYWESCGTTRPVVLWANLQTRANLSGKLKHKFVLFFSYSRHYRAFLRLQLTLFLRAVSMN